MVFKQLDTFGNFVKDQAAAFVNTFGKAPKEAKKQRKINPELQRTQLKGTEKGVTTGTKKPIFKVVQDGIVRSKNRSVPLNSNPNKRKRG